MKKVLLSTVVLFLFSLSITTFQISCSKGVEAQTNTSFTPKGKFIYLTSVSGSSYEIWTSNYDGTGKTRINVTIPAGHEVDELEMSVDGTKIFYDLYQLSSGRGFIYSSNVDGTNMTKIIDGSILPAGTSIHFGNTY